MNDLNSKTIAVVGVSRNKAKYGFIVFKDLLDAGYDVFGVNPNADYILGKRIYNTLYELPKKPDIVVTVTPSEVTEKVVDACRDIGVNEIWMQPGSESEEAVKKAEKGGISVIHNACIMIEKGSK
ncbi:hypothetical protein BEH94_06500 [Candidatus Altiarchaeales archaeon WOR_SM1_SCG]|nr:hypothetical protein BEH94_06500 [Candidatus Altiarchaeales archaeon WOR_SM1_SCG]ODS36824.1 MAG: hypothetical protein A7315_13910 [Candidatus Altiarchaeales archaeon WOR_SM1_79]ODS37707.1 MAG: hypothetical protein A7316_09125 [Candidatus Altiarchaeales archaeon WOR_SM1_86-2]